MTITILHTLDWLLWLFLAASVLYVCVFALVSLLRPCATEAPPIALFSDREFTFLVLYPAYHEDGVICHSVEEFLKQDYPREKYRLVVISDHMSEATNQRLRSYPITVLTPQFEKSSKAKALQYAMGQMQEPSDYVVVLDADNVVRPDFLTRLNVVCRQGHQAIQCHRCAKNADNDIAMLDGVSEEINNTLFRKAHNRVGLSSALIGSGMCFSYFMFERNVHSLSSAVEDRELEALLLQQRVHIHYAEHIPVYDEKVSNKDNFQRQRLRWMTGQVQSLLAMLPQVPSELVSGNMDYIDKTIQQALVPRSILLVTLLVLSVLLTVLAPALSWKWWGLFLLLCVSVFIAIPPSLRTVAVFRQVRVLPGLVWRMVRNLFRIDKNNKDFIHTSHTT